MYSLILMTCISLQCEHIEVVSMHTTLEACEKAMIEKFETTKEGEAMLCIQVVEDEVQT